VWWDEQRKDYLLKPCAQYEKEMVTLWVNTLKEKGATRSNYLDVACLVCSHEEMFQREEKKNSCGIW